MGKVCMLLAPLPGGNGLEAMVDEAEGQRVVEAFDAFKLGAEGTTKMIRIVGQTRSGGKTTTALDMSECPSISVIEMADGPQAQGPQLVR